MFLCPHCANLHVSVANEQHNCDGECLILQRRHTDKLPGYTAFRTFCTSHQPLSSKAYPIDTQQHTTVTIKQFFSLPTMATYAVLGATGQIGSHILQLLLRDHPSAEIKVLVRSRAKLEALLPDTSYSLRLHIYEGAITDIPILTDCLRGVKTVFLTVATMYNIPHTRIAQDQAEAVVAALENLFPGRRQQQQRQRHDEKNGTSTKTNGVKSGPAAATTTTIAAASTITAAAQSKDVPFLVMISSAETQANPFCLDIPYPIRTLLFYCNYWIYTDLIAAETYLRQRSDWVDAVFFKPGGIAHDIQRGHILSTEKSQTFVSFWDVAAAMIDCGSENDRKAMAGQNVSVLSRGKAKLPLGTPLLLLKNLMGYLFPHLYERCL